MSIDLSTLSAGKMRSCLSRLTGSLYRATSGALAVEFALIAPILLLIMVASVDLGMGLYTRMQVQNAAQAGVEYAIAHGFAATAISSAVTSATSLSGIEAAPAPSEFCGCPTASGVTTATCGSTCSGGIGAGTYVTVTAQATYTTVVPFPLFPDSYSFTEASTVRIQ
jgi:Flp pilus assembly protein TadG